MKSSVTIAIAFFTLLACKSKTINTENFPKDISLKTENNLKEQADRQKLTAMIKGIDSLVQRQKCENSSDWTFTAIGAKPCGGPASYIAYPKNMEEEILPQIKNFTTSQNTFNKKYKLMSDCMVVPDPHEIKCENGKAVLSHEN